MLEVIDNTHDLPKDARIDLSEVVDTAVKVMQNLPRPTAEMERESNKRHFGLYMTNDEVLEHWSKQRGENK